MQESAQGLQVHRSLNDLAFSFAHAAGKVRGLETQAAGARASAEVFDLESHKLRLQNLQLISQLTLLEKSPA